MEEKNKAKEENKYAKEGFSDFVLPVGDKKMLLYVEDGVNKATAFEGAFQFAVHLKELQRQEILAQMAKKKEEKEAKEEKDAPKSENEASDKA